MRLSASAVLVLGMSLAGGAAMAAPHPVQVAAPDITHTIPGMANLKVEKKIVLKAYGLTAYVVKTPEGRRSVFYTDNSGKKFMFLGLVIGPGGQNETAKLLKTYNKPVDYAKLASTIASRKVIHDGSHGPLIYAFFDPNCIFCHKLWAGTRTAVEQGKLQIDWLPVAFLKPSSQGKAVAIMAAKDPLDAMNRNEINFNSMDEEGGIKPADLARQDAADRQALQQIDENEATMRAYHFNGTPTIVFKGKKDQKWHAFGGMPPGGAATIIALAD